MRNLYFRSKTRWWKTSALTAIGLAAWFLLIWRMVSAGTQDDGFSTIIFTGAIVMPVGAIVILGLATWIQEWIDRGHGVAEDL